MQCGRSQQKTEGESERERYGEGFWGQRRLEASVIRIIAMFLVPVSASPVLLCGLIFKFVLGVSRIPPERLSCASI